MSKYVLQTRKPTGRVPHPLGVVEGGDKTGKSWASIALTADPRIGRAFLIDVNEGSGDEYGAIPGANYEIVEHDGSFEQIYYATLEIRKIAEQAERAGEPPVLLIIDSITNVWELLKAIADKKARERAEKKAREQKRYWRPDVEVTITPDIWNKINGQHRLLMQNLTTFPGIVILTARGKDVAAMDENGRPIAGTREYKVEAHKNLPYEASFWVRLSREHPPTLVGARSVRAGVRPGIDKPMVLEDFSLAKVIFDILGYDPGNTHTRKMAAMKVTDGDVKTQAFLSFEEKIKTAGIGELRALWSEFHAAHREGQITVEELEALRELANSRKQEIEEANEMQQNTEGLQAA